MKFGNIIEWLVVNKELLLTLAGLCAGLIGFYINIKIRLNSLDSNNKLYNNETVSLLKIISERENVKPFIEDLLTKNKSVEDKLSKTADLLLTVYKNSTLDSDVKSEVENIVSEIKYDKNTINEITELKSENETLKKNLEQVINKKEVKLETKDSKKSNKVRL